MATPGTASTWYKVTLSLLWCFTCWILVHQDHNILGTIGTVPDDLPVLHILEQVSL
jgi:hypothetical protein